MVEKMQTTKVFRNGNSQAIRIPSELAYERTDIELEIESLVDPPGRAGGRRLQQRRHRLSTALRTGRPTCRPAWSAGGCGGLDRSGVDLLELPQHSGQLQGQ